MEVFINNQSYSVSEAVSLREVLLQHHLSDKKGIAVAVNNSVVPKTEWERYKIVSADKITIIRATQGG